MTAKEYRVGLRSMQKTLYAMRWLALHGKDHAVEVLTPRQASEWDKLHSMLNRLLGDVEQRVEASCGSK